MVTTPPVPGPTFNYRATANPRRTVAAPAYNVVRQNHVRVPNSDSNAVASGTQLLARAQGLSAPAPLPAISAAAASGSERQARIQQAVSARNQFWNDGMITNMTSSRLSGNQRASLSAADRDRYLASALQLQFTLDNYDEDEDDDDIDVSSISFSVQNALDFTGSRYEQQTMNPYDQLLTRYETSVIADQTGTQNQRADTTEGAAGGADKNEPKSRNTGKEPQPKKVKPEAEPEVLPPTFRWVHIEIVDAPNANNS